MTDTPSADAADYFAAGAPIAEVLTEGTWIDSNTDVTPIELVPGLVFRPIIGDRLAASVVHFEPNVVAPVHAHVEEQISLVLEGELEFEVNGERRLLRPGMAVVIPPNTPHGARTHDSPCVEIDLFHPPRQGLLDAMRKQQERAGRAVRRGEGAD
ncbi:MAG: cupin domain-containing protein [Chloroflexi bacterium]|nr:cupin domain-containing protein [Chloroflexota bacterium]